MPYYVCAIHTDSTTYRIYEIFDNYNDARDFETEMQLGTYPGDNYFVYSTYAENETDLEERINEVRRQRGISTSS